MESRATETETRATEAAVTFAPPLMGAIAEVSTGGRAGAMSRRAALSGMVALAGAAVLTGCTPLRILMRWYPEAFDRDPELTGRVLRAFVDTVIPGAPAGGDPNLAHVFFDPGLPFADHAAFFAADLCRRAESRHGCWFDGLSRPQRVEVVRDGLSGDATARRLYDGAIFLAQISCFAGIYDDRRGCPLIDFEGGYHLLPREELTFPEPGRFLPAPVTRSGNPA